jgi:hypothetical protein
MSLHKDVWDFILPVMVEMIHLPVVSEMIHWLVMSERFYLSLMKCCHWILIMPYSSSDTIPFKYRYKLKFIYFCLWIYFSILPYKRSHFFPVFLAYLNFKLCFQISVTKITENKLCFQISVTKITENKLSTSLWCL